ncbi:MAG: head GIN domain-containing protein [Pseudomonadales bacterium]
MTLRTSLLAFLSLLPVSLAAVEKAYEVADFKALHFSGVGEVHVVQSGRESLVVTGSEEALEAVTVEVDHGVLYIEVDTRHRFRRAPQFELEVKTIGEITALGAGRVHAEGLVGRELFVAMHGSSRIVLERLAVHELNASSRGSGEFTVTGRVERQVVSLAGASRYTAEELASNYGEVSIRGAADARVAVAEVLDVMVSGAGSVEYIGSPRVYETVNGAGRIVSYGR